MSNRKQRQLDRIAPEVRLLSDVREIAKKPFVLSVEDHFAGYFKELGITVRLAIETTDSEIIALRNELLTYLSQAFSEQKLEFTWQVDFRRGTDQAALLFPGDRPIEGGAPLELIF
ncbi:MAG: hypothetical protein EOO15_14090 [Chitinophagaceae bacterium]|nr:MAG: hypothetical protein EOO15_14090 [Chitinophagaceae bacterium]